MMTILDISRCSWIYFFHNTNNFLHEIKPHFVGTPLCGDFLIRFLLYFLCIPWMIWLLILLSPPAGIRGCIFQMINMHFEITFHPLRGGNPRRQNFVLSPQGFLVFLDIVIWDNDNIHENPSSILWGKAIFRNIYYKINIKILHPKTEMLAKKRHIQ